MKTISKIIAVLSISILPLISHAATLSLSPSSGSYKQGDFFTINVLVSSPDKTMNAASGFISFPADLLSVSSISKTNSIVNFWAQEPSFSNSSGNVIFESVLLPPGFIGSSGKIISITFKAKAVGTANLTFSSGSVLAADGSGTDILTFSNDAFINITEGNPTPTPKVVSTTGVPEAPEIISSTHPDSTNWYASKEVNFSWSLTKDITKSSVLFDRNPNSSPVVSFSPATNSISEKDLEEGVSYLHIQLKNNKGWGNTSHFKVQVDTEKPTSFNITETKKTDSSEQKLKFIFSASDKTSGIDHFEVQIDNGDVDIWRDDGSHEYIVEGLSAGKHILTAKAIDKAGNWLSSYIEFSTYSTSPSINKLLIKIIFAISILIVLLVIWYIWRRFFLSFKKKTKKDVHGMEIAIHKAFELLKGNVREQIKMLEKARTKRELTDEEEKIIRHLRKDLDDAERFIRKEVEGIEKRIK